MDVRSGYKQTEVGAIPSDWEVTSVGRAFEICNNLRLPISQAVRKQMEGPFPYYGPTSIQGYINEYRVEGEYALIGEDGDHFLKWQDQPMTQLVSGRFNVNNHAHLIRGSKNVTAWFYHYFSRRDLTPYLTRQGAGRFKLTKSTLTEIPCALPPTKAEQEAIAEALSDADALIESLEQLLVKKRQLKQGAMQELLTGKKRLPGFSEEWVPRMMSSIGATYGGLSGKTKDDFGVGDAQYVTFMNVLENVSIECERFDRVRVALGEAQNSVREGDLLFNGTSETPEDLAMGAVLLDEVDHLYLNSFCFGFRIRDSQEHDALFIAYCFRGSVGRNMMYSLAQGSTRYNMSKRQFLDLELTLPTHKEQIAIATALSDMDGEIAALEAKLTKTRQLKQGMMQELLTGRIRLI